MDGFTPPADHFKKYILPISIGADPDLALKTRRGTGYYKVPSLKDWFDPKRLRNDYVPTGWKGYGVKTRAVKGHEFGLKLSADDKKALISFI